MSRLLELKVALPLALPQATVLSSAGVVSEGGFTDNSERLLLGERWEAIIRFMTNLQDQGKAYWSINEWGCAGTCAGGHTTATLAQKLAGKQAQTGRLSFAVAVVSCSSRSNRWPQGPRTSLARSGSGCWRRT